jgi:chromosome partitioning protein
VEHGRTAQAALAKLYGVIVIHPDPVIRFKREPRASAGGRQSRLSRTLTRRRASSGSRDVATTTPFVVVDSLRHSVEDRQHAIAQGDFVTIPTQGPRLGANEASWATRVVFESEKMTGRAKPYALLLTRSSLQIRTSGLAHIQNGLICAGISVETELNERDAFKAIFYFQQTLSTSRKGMWRSPRAKFWRGWRRSRAGSPSSCRVASISIRTKGCC